MAFDRYRRSQDYINERRTPPDYRTVRQDILPGPQRVQPQNQLQALLMGLMLLFVCLQIPAWTPKISQLDREFKLASVQ